MRAAWWAVVVGGALPLLLGATLGSTTTTAGAGTWAAPMPAGAFVVLSLGLAVSHLLVVPAYTVVGRTGPRTALRRPAHLGALGSVVLAVCELWSGALARTPLDEPVLDVLDGAYAVGALAVVVGTLWLGALLLRAAPRSPLARPVVVNGLLLLVASCLRFFVGDGPGIAALTVWSLSYVWWGLLLRRLAGRQPRRQSLDASAA